MIKNNTDRKSSTKKPTCLLLSLILIVSMFSTVSFAQESSSLVEVELTSAIDGSSFISSFNPETGIVSALTMNGELIGQRHDYTLEEFEELVEINKEMTSEMTKPELSPIQGILPFRFNTQPILMSRIPKEKYPSDSNVSIGGFRLTRAQDRYVVVTTFEIPYSPDFVATIDVFIINDYGDDYTDEDNEEGFGIGENDTFTFRINYPGERYCAYVSNAYITLYDIYLQFSSR